MDIKFIRYIHCVGIDSLCVNTFIHKVLRASILFRVFNIAFCNGDSILRSTEVVYLSRRNKYSKYVEHNWIMVYETFGSDIITSKYI